MRFGKRAGLALGCLVAIVAFGLGRAVGRPDPGSNIIGVYGVGGVIAQDGTLWQYHPGEKRWMTIDEAFKLEKKQTRILPLPVPADQIRFMESFGFLVTKAGQVWQYDLERNRWQNIGLP